jgi:glycosyltransferase involved in cell wall biosynthesis
MNILWLSHLAPYPPKGGVKQRSYNLMHEISKYHKLYIICFLQKSHQPTLEKKREALEGLSRVGKVIGNFTFDSDRSQWSSMLLAMKSLLTRDPYTVNWLKKPGVGFMIENAIHENNIDLVHFDTISWAAYLGRTNNCKIVMNHHNIESHMMLRRAQREHHLIKKLYYYQEGRKLKYYEKRVCSQFDLNITCSSTDTERLLKDLPQLHVDDIPNGVDLNYFHPMGLEQKPSSMIFAGGLSWYPNIAAMEYFTKLVWKILVKDVPGANMTVIGRNPPQWIIDFAKNNNNFDVTGFVDDVRPYIDQAAVYVCPITDGGGTKLKILDALAMGKAIVTHPIACEGIDVTEGKDVIFADTPQEYVDKIKMLFQDDKLRDSIGRNGRKLIENKYNFVNIGKKLNRLYTALL